MRPRSTCGSPMSPIRSAARGRPDSYLRGDAIVEAARKAGAQAIHPGYGFLSENADFAEAVERAGIAFIGPSADSMRRMGSKAGAKDLMAGHGVPVVPGYTGEDQDPALLAREAAAHRFSADDQGRARRRRQGHAHRARGQRVRRESRILPARSEERVRPRSRAARALHREAAPHRVPDFRRHARQRRPSQRARMLGAAPLPESARGNALAVRHAGDAREDGRSRDRRRARARLRQCGHGRIHRRRRPAISISWKSTRACRSSIRSPKWCSGSISSNCSCASPPAKRCPAR